MNDLVIIIRSVGFSLSWIPFFYLFCDIGGSVSAAFADLNQLIYENSWELCPMELQKYTILMMASTQKPIHMKGFGSLHCSRETFKIVGVKGHFNTGWLGSDFIIHVFHSG